MNSIGILDCPVHNLSMQETINTIEDYIRSGEPHQIIPMNASKLWWMQKDLRLKRIVDTAALIIPEKAIVMGSRVLGSPLKAHIGGITLLKNLLPVASERGYRIYFLGARPKVVEQMTGELRQRSPELRVCGWHHGYFSPADTPELIRRIKAAKPDMLFVALGTPRQEYWISENLHELGVPVCMGVGGSFDVLAGLKKDAPDWVRSLALEWLYRLVQDPRNLWKRYLITIPWFCSRVFSIKARRIFAR